MKTYENDGYEKRYEKTKKDEDSTGSEGDYDFDDYSMNEELVDTDSKEQSSENVIQKMDLRISWNARRMWIKFIILWFI